MFICGSGSFGHQDEMEIEGCNSNNSPCSTPKRSKRSTSFCKIMSRDNGNKNPYADRGLDKFYALLADLDDKKQKIYTEKGNEDISFVRFVYTNESDKAKPIVVKVKERNTDKKMMVQTSFKNKSSVAADSAEKTKIDPAPIATSVDKEEGKRGIDQKVKRRRCLVRSCSLNGSFKLQDLKQPQFYFAVMVVMILLLLAIYGRSFAILCTSIVWYLAPTITGEGSSSLSSERKPKRKKEYTSRRSERKVVDSVGPSSPKSVINGLNDSRVQEHGPKRSW